MFHPLRIEPDIQIPMRDGASLSANLFRPDAEGRFPAIMTLGPYPKDIHFKDWDRLGPSPPAGHRSAGRPAARAVHTY